MGVLGQKPNLSGEIVDSQAVDSQTVASQTADSWTIGSQHMCVCRGCMQRNSIGEPTQEGAWNFCPLCCGEIKKILPKDGTEVQKYWAWVEEVKPKLPRDFALKFEIHGGLIRDEVAERNHKNTGPASMRRSSTCAIS